MQRSESRDTLHDEITDGVEANTSDGKFFADTAARVYLER